MIFLRYLQKLVLVFQDGKNFQSQISFHFYQQLKVFLIIGSIVVAVQTCGYLRLFELDRNSSKNQFSENKKEEDKSDNDLTSKDEEKRNHKKPSSNEKSVKQTKKPFLFEALVEACNVVRYECNQGRACGRLTQNEAKLKEVGVLVSKDGSSDLTVKNSDVNVRSNDVADEVESIGTAKLAIDSNRYVRGERNLELLKAVPMLKELNGEIDTFVKRLKSVANISRISPNDPEITGWLLNNI
uniref:Uncharacterized protein n=1 Tax=Strongyloides venezuelensis TaxID=75913 RepID=A0A0K0FHA6_STRVS